MSEAVADPPGAVDWEALSTAEGHLLPALPGQQNQWSTLYVHLLETLPSSPAVQRVVAAMAVALFLFLTLRLFRVGGDVALLNVTSVTGARDGCHHAYRPSHCCSRRSHLFDLVLFMTQVQPPAAFALQPLCNGG